MACCLFCSNRQCFSIVTAFQDGHTIRDDMLSFFGYQVEDELTNDECLCKVCVNIISSMARLKRRLMQFINPKDGKKCKPTKLAKTWSALQILDDWDDESDVVIQCSTSRMNLVECTKTEPYNEHYEQELSDYYSYNSAYGDEPKQARAGPVTRGRKRKGSRRRWTRPKRRSASKPAPRPGTAVSFALTIGSRPPSVDVEAPPVESRIVPQADIQKLNDNMPDYYDDFNLFICTECDYTSENVISFSNHKQYRHHHLAKFQCDSCDKQFTDADYLQIHLKSHRTRIACIACKESYTNTEDLMRHWRLHFETAVECKHCRKRYFNSFALKKHIAKEHKINTELNRVVFRTQTAGLSKEPEFKMKILQDD